MRLQLARWGNSLAIRLPAEYLRKAGLSEGDEIEAEITPLGEIRLAPTRAFDKAAFLARLRQLHARIPRQAERAADLVRHMRDGDRF
jgi:antitoxin MazE